MAKTDPKDDRIAELELALEAANKATAEAIGNGSRIVGLDAENARLVEALKVAQEEIKKLQAEIEQYRASVNPGERSSVKGLDTTKSVELRVSSLVLNTITKQPVTALAGSVLVEESAFAELSKKLGTSVVLHPVAASEIAAAKKSGRAY